MALVSIVIPCYNVEKYIDRCMNTVVNQTIGIENLEIILVNDASTDHTLDKLKEWEAKYPNQIIVVTYEKNMNIGGARNAGMQYASSEYIGFVDADDWIELDMYETLYRHTQNGYYDMVAGKEIRCHAEEKIECVNNVEVHIYEFEEEKGFYKHKVSEKGQNGEYGHILTAIYRKERIMNNNVMFPENTAYEDNYWFTVLKLYIKNLCIVDKIVYHYFVNPYSTVTSRNARHHLDRLPIEISILETYQQLGVFEIFKTELECEFMQRFFLNTWYIIFTRFDYIPDIFNDMKKIILDFFPNYKEELKFEDCPSRQKMLIGLLDDSKELTEHDLEKAKYIYLKELYLDV